MHKLNNKRLIFVALFALIITLVVNFPSIIDVFYSDLSDIPHFPNGEGRPPFHDNNFPPGPAPFLSNPDKPFLTKEMFKIFQIGRAHV